MKTHLFVPHGQFYGRRVALCLGSIAFASIASAQVAPIAQPVLPIISRSTVVGPISPSTLLNVNVCLKLPNPQALHAFVDSVSNPKSPTYRHFITPAKFGQQFGQTPGVVNAVVNYLKSQGLTIKLTAKNNLNIMASGTAKQVQAAFNTTIYNYHANSPKEITRQNFYSYSSVPKLPSSFAKLVIDVEGLDNSVLPHRATTLTPPQCHVLYNTQPMYSTGSQGQGMHVGVSNFAGFSLANTAPFYAMYGLPVPAGGINSNVSVVTIDGGAMNNGEDAEGDLDFEMVLGEAPLCNLIEYDCGGSMIDSRTVIANDNVADIITESYGFGFGASTGVAANQLAQQMSSQGQTFCHATGDSGTTIDPFFYPDAEPEAVGVGGSAAKTDVNGNRISEVGWDGGGGGWAIDVLPFNTLPSWQVAPGVPTNINFRLQPDVTAQGAGDQFLNTNAVFFFFGGQLNSVSGTSVASPLWSGCLAVTEQWLIANGWTGNGNTVSRFGRIQDLFYSQYQTNVANHVWYDITTGDNGALPDGTESVAGPNWDFATGLGTLDFNAFANTIATVTLNLGSGTASIYSDNANGTLGTNASGSDTNLVGNNGLSYNVQSVSSVYGPAVGVQLQFTGLTQDFTSLSLTLGASAAQGTTLFVYALDAQGNYDLVSTDPLTSNSSTITVSGLQKYILSGQNFNSSRPGSKGPGGVPNGTLTLVTRAIIPSRFNVNQFALSINQATLSGHAKAGT
jgi:subtilase family serine protease